ncbi:hypothetical protein [Marinobacter daqiaonensis]|uniref:hypothetical protein n=1 Tax=Marinobacter daqiaonensis TaxID=650891 RepID=UPI001113A6FB|nr:hypothetical protein [Marinobacter daqiaonensis]
MSFSVLLLPYFLKVSLKKYELIAVSLSLFFLSVTFTIGLVKGGVFSFRVVELAVYFPIIFLSANTLVLLILKNYSAASIYIILINSILFNSVFVIFLNLGVLDVVGFYNFVHIDPKVFTYPIQRYPGFAYDSFSYLSALNAFGLCLLLDCSFKRIIKSRLYISVSIIIIAASIVLSGRVGIVIVLLYLFSRLLTFNLSAMKNILIMGIAFFSLTLLDWGSYEWYKDWSFSFLRRIFSGSSQIDSSVSGIVSHHIFLPERLLIGDSIKFSDVKSDLGIVRMINSSGFVGAILYSLYFLFLFVIAVISRSFIAIFFVVMLFLLNFKDVYFVSPYGFNFFLMVVLLSKFLLSQRKENKDAYS